METIKRLIKIKKIKPKIIIIILVIILFIILFILLDNTHKYAFEDCKWSDTKYGYTYEFKNVDGENYYVTCYDQFNNITRRSEAVLKDGVIIEDLPTNGNKFEFEFSKDGETINVRYVYTSGKVDEHETLVKVDE